MNGLIVECICATLLAGSAINSFSAKCSRMKLFTFLAIASSFIEVRPFEKR